MAGGATTRTEPWAEQKEFLKTGFGEAVFGVLPSRLKWLRGRHAFMLFLGTLVPVFSTILVVLYRLEVLPID